MKKKIDGTGNKISCASICFFDAYPPQSGSGVVCWDFFQSIPIIRKKFFQLSVNKNTDNRSVKNISILRNNPVFKIIFLPFLILSINNFFYKSDDKILIIEGPSWAFYSYITLLYFKIFRNDIKLIYRSHSIEYEIRKKNSNFLISYLTKYFERKIYKISDITTCVSKIEQNKIKNLYDVKPYIFPNSILFSKFKKLIPKKIMKLPNKFIFFCGSYEYKPNKEAIDLIIKSILPKIIHKRIYLVISGGCNKKFKEKNVINLNKISKNKLKYLYLNCLALVVPIFEGYGTRIKILEAIALNTKVITTPKGIEGINYNDYNFIKVVKKIKYFPKEIMAVRKKKNKNQKIFEYDMHVLTKTFFKKFIIKQ